MPFLLLLLRFYLILIPLLSLILTCLIQNHNRESGTVHFLLTSFLLCLYKFCTLSLFLLSVSFTLITHIVLYSLIIDPGLSSPVKTFDLRISQNRSFLTHFSPLFYVLSARVILLRLYRVVVVVVFIL